MPRLSRSRAQRPAEPSPRAGFLDCAAAALVLLVALLGATANAAADVLVTNLDPAGSISNTRNRTDIAQVFRTGANAGGYTLESIDTHVHAITTLSLLNASVWTVDASGHPDTKQFDLTTPSALSETNFAVLAAPADATLAADTSYAVVARTTATGSSSFSLVTTDTAGTSTFGFTTTVPYLEATTTDDTTTYADMGELHEIDHSKQVLRMVVNGAEKSGGNAAPTLDNPLADQEAIAGQPFSFQIPADAFSDPDGDTLTYSAGNVPTWLTFTPGTRTFSGTPPGSLTLAPNEVNVTATDPGGLFVQDIFKLTLFVNVPDLTSGDGDVLVTNLDQDASSTTDFSANGVGQAFTTGSHAAGYTLGSIEIAFKAFDSSSTEIEKVSASLWSTTTDSFGNVRPNMNVQALTLAGTITNTGTTRFTAPAGTTLDADTSYAVVLTYSGSDSTTFTARITESTSETSSFGFNLEDNKVYGTGGTATISNEPLMMRVIGAEKTAVAESCAAPDFGTREQIWTGTVTVASITGAGHGFQEGVSGALDDKTFTIGADTYTIDAALVATATNLDGDLIFSLTGSYGENMLTQQDAVRLHVCDTPYDLSDGAPEGGNLVSGFDLPRHNSYRWALDLDWSSETTRTLYLSIPANSPATGDPTITSSGDAAEGDVLTADSSAIMDADGLPDSFAYQWYREDEDGSNQAAIAGETASAYTLAAADVGKRVRVRVSFDDDLGRAEERDSAPWPDTGTVVAASTTCAAPDLAGRRQIWSAVLTPEQTGTQPDFWGYSSQTSKGSLSPNAFSIGPTSFTFTNLIAVTDTRLNIILDTGLSTAQQNALRLHVCDTAFDFSDDTDTANSAVMQITTSDIDWTDGAVRNVYLSLPANNAAAGTPTVSGTATVNQTLTADTTGITDTDGLPAAFTYQWLRENEDGTMQELIPGATSSTYDLVTADVGKRGAGAGGIHRPAGRRGVGGQRRIPHDGHGDGPAHHHHRG